MSNIFYSIHVQFNHLCSVLPIKCVHKCVDELHKISCNSDYNYINNTVATGAFQVGAAAPRVFFTRNTCFHLFVTMVVCKCNATLDHVVS